MLLEHVAGSDITSYALSIDSTSEEWRQALSDIKTLRLQALAAYLKKCRLPADRIEAVCTYSSDAQPAPRISAAEEGTMHEFNQACEEAMTVICGELSSAYPHIKPADYIVRHVMLSGSIDQQDAPRIEDFPAPFDVKRVLQYTKDTGRLPNTLYSKRPRAPAGQRRTRAGAPALVTQVFA